MEPPQPASITPTWLALREELKESHEKLKALEVAIARQSPPKNLANGVSRYRDYWQRRKDLLRIQLSFDSSSQVVQEKLKKESEIWTERESQQSPADLRLVEKWISSSETKTLQAKSLDAPFESLQILRKRIEQNPLANTLISDAAVYFGVKASTIKKWLQGVVKGKKLKRAGKPGYVSNESIIKLDKRLRR